MAGINAVKMLAQAGMARTLADSPKLDSATVGDTGRGGPLSGPLVAGTGNQAPFAEQLNSLLTDVNGLQQQAASLAEGLARGSVTDLHQVMLAQEEASVAFKLVAEMRNKLVQAYQEVLRMPV